MFINDKIIFTELHKTGGTHIGQWLNDLIGGVQNGKHNRIPQEFWDNKFIIGSCRNPWDWYVSLWAFGCGGQGSVYQQTTNRFDLKYLSNQLHSEMGFERTNLKYWILQFVHDFFKPVKVWQTTYMDYADANAFREWLKLILNYSHRFDVREGFGFSPISKNFGLMTYRYIKLFTTIRNSLYSNKSLATMNGIQKIWKKHRLANFIIRTECLETDLIEALKLGLCKLNQTQEAEILKSRENKINSSERHPAHYYYDKESIELVAKREAFIIDTHHYAPPHLS